MKPPVILLSAGLALMGAHPLLSSSLLSDNVARTGSASYPGTTSKVSSQNRIGTAATYSFLTGESTETGPGNTDPHILELGKSQERLLDGYNERVGNTAIYGAWQSEYGATIVFDLNEEYDVSQVSASIREDSSRGTATFQAFVSEDGVTYSPLGAWDGSKVVLDSAESDPGRNTEIVISAPTPVKARYVKLYLSHWNEDHSARKYNQLVVGEVAIWGEKK
jgi:hypothetical protein